MLNIFKEKNINFVHNRQVNRLSGLKKWSSLNFLECELTRLFSLVLGFLISMSKVIYKTYLVFLHYVIIVMAS